ncbi:MAG: biotin--[acetyl-CoA-carboxylase] ligase [Actinomycetes bacterium]
MIRLALDQAKISSNLADSYWRVKVFEQLTSTQTVLRASKPMHGDVCIAEYQSSGRGRLNRTFEAPSQTSLLFSFYVKPLRPQSDWGWVPLLIGTAVAEEINIQTSLHSFATKWPNDVIATSGKISGILSEVHDGGILVGVGINVTTKIEELPVVTASSIWLESNVELDRNLFFVSLLQRFAKVISEWESGVDFRDRYLTLNTTVGKQVVISRPGQADLESTAIGIATTGGLIIESGEVITVGDITHVR